MMQKLGNIFAKRYDFLLKNGKKDAISCTISTFLCNFAAANSEGQNTSPGCLTNWCVLRIYPFNLNQVMLA